MILGRALCWLLGLVKRDPHKWRRLRKAEREVPRFYTPGTIPSWRTCRRCGATRMAKARKRNG